MSRVLIRVLGLCSLLALPAIGWPACCYFSAKNADILQPAQKAFLTWDPAEKIETFTVQPKFEGHRQHGHAARRSSWRPADVGRSDGIAYVGGAAVSGESASRSSNGDHVDDPLLVGADAVGLIE
jgi:hypothetical protein